MNQRSLFALWGGLFILCAALGFIPEPQGVLRGVLTILSVLFFLPGAALLFQAAQRGDRRTARLIRDLAALSLALTVGVLIVSFLTALSSQQVGAFLYGLLVIVSSPMICGGYWALSLFLWACLLIASWKVLRRR